MEGWKIQSWLGSNEFHEDTKIADMVASMRLKFVKILGRVHRHFKCILKGVDPRLKFKVLSIYHSSDPATYKSRMDYIRKRMLKLYGDYKKNTSAHSSQEVEDML
uniref:hAT-like transposase RNase-H fold domain-containing protein n=1 Tax=Brassica oleracea TaxID=3712 RepID=A0A3P6AAB1_BRAOL|nr:unnamed protein product [Brassica oleracea]